MTRDATGYFFFGLLVILTLMVTASNGDRHIPDPPLVVRAALTSEERLHCALWFNSKTIADLAPRGSRPAIKSHGPQGPDLTAARLPRTVDLNDADALEVVQNAKPDHYASIVKVLDEVLTHSWAEAVSVPGYQVNYSSIVLTSAPPQRRLRFTVDDTDYVATIRLSSSCVLPAVK